jgi:hypothetical protein
MLEELQFYKDYFGKSIKIATVNKMARLESFENHVSKKCMIQKELCLVS